MTRQNNMAEVTIENLRGSRKLLCIVVRSSGAATKENLTTET